MKIDLFPYSPDKFEDAWEVQRQAMRRYVEAIYGWDDADQRERFSKSLSDSSLMLIKNEDRIIGFWEAFLKDGSWFLSRVALLPEFQGKGVGTDLIRSLVDVAEKEKRPVTLQVFKVNPARMLYERLGFIVVEETKTHFIMVKNEPKG